MNTDNVRGKSLDAWKRNAEEDYGKTPISVLKYITILEELLEAKNSDTADVETHEQPNELGNTLSLKWGTLKGWNFENSPKGQRLLDEYYSFGSSESRMSQKDTERQKEIICELIDLCEDNKIYLEWDCIWVSKDVAKEYVMNYSKE